MKRLLMLACIIASASAVCASNALGQNGPEASALPTPRLFTVEPGEYSATVKWRVDDASKIDHFNVYRFVEGDDGPIQVGTAPASARRFTDTGLSEGHTYLYTVASASGTEESARPPMRSAQLIKLKYHQPVGGVSPVKGCPLMLMWTPQAGLVGTRASRKALRLSVRLRVTQRTGRPDLIDPVVAYRKGHACRAIAHVVPDGVGVMGELIWRAPRRVVRFERIPRGGLKWAIVTGRP